MDAEALVWFRWFFCFFYWVNMWPKAPLTHHYCYCLFVFLLCAVCKIKQLQLQFIYNETSPSYTVKECQYNNDKTKDTSCGVEVGTAQRKNTSFEPGRENLAVPVSQTCIRSLFQRRGAQWAETLAPKDSLNRGPDTNPAWREPKGHDVG